MKDPMKELGAIAREREAERERFEADPAKVPAISDAQRARAIAAAVAMHRAAPQPQRAWMPRVLAFGGALAVAAVVLVMFVIPKPGALPSYTLEVPSLGYSSTRSAPSTSDLLKLKKGMELDVVLRPDAPVERAVSAKASMIIDGTPVPLDWSPELAPTGAVRFRGELGREVKLPLGRSRLRFEIETRAMELDVEVVE